MSLPTIPFETDNPSVQGLIERYPEHFEGMITACYTAVEELDGDKLFGWTDRRSEKSMRINADRWAPYKGEFDYVHQRIADLRGGDLRGAATILLTDEWGCSTRSMRQDDGTIEMQRLLDIVPHVGHLPIVTKKPVASGDCITATYPGLIGEAHGMTQAFAIAQHVAPTPKTILGKVLGECVIPFDYLVNARRNTANKGYAPTILVRKALEEARTADEALEMLSSEPLTSPILYHFATTDRAYLIERMPDDSVVHEAANMCGTNTWQNDRFPDAWSKPHAPTPVHKGESGEERLEIIRHTMRTGGTMQPSYKPLTRLHLDMNPARGTFRAQGLEHDQPATEAFEHEF